MSEKLNQEELERLARYRELEQLRKYLGIRPDFPYQANQMLIAVVVNIQPDAFDHWPISSAIDSLEKAQRHMIEHTDRMIRDLKNGSWRSFETDQTGRIHWAEGAKDEPTK